MTDLKIVSILSRKDLFLVDDDRNIGKLTLLSLVFGIAGGILLSTMQFVEVGLAFLPDLSEVDIIRTQILPYERPFQKIRTEKKDIIRNDLKKNSEIKKNSTKSSSNGNLTDIVNQQALLGILSGFSKTNGIAGNKPIESFVDDVFKTISNTTGLKTAGVPEIGRTGIQDKVFNSGSTVGGGEEGTGIEDLMKTALMANKGLLKTINKIRIIEKVETPEIVQNSSVMGGRSVEEIRKVVFNHMGGLRNEYNKRLRGNPSLSGKISVRFSINPEGRIASCHVILSTLNDKILESALVSRITTWQFDSCLNCGLATVVYPFVFSQ
jgi:TonB family protein